MEGQGGEVVERRGEEIFDHSPGLGGRWIGMIRTPLPT